MILPPGRTLLDYDTRPKVLDLARRDRTGFGDAFGESAGLLGGDPAPPGPGRGDPGGLGDLAAWDLAALFAPRGFSDGGAGFASPTTPPPAPPGIPAPGTTLALGIGVVQLLARRRPARGA